MCVKYVRESIEKCTHVYYKNKVKFEFDKKYFGRTRTSSSWILKIGISQKVISKFLLNYTKKALDHFENILGKEKILDSTWELQVGNYIINFSKSVKYFCVIPLDQLAGGDDDPVWVCAV